MESVVVYAVRRGRKQGLFASWSECQQQVSGFSGAEFRKFADRERAQEWVDGEKPRQQQQEEEEEKTNKKRKFIVYCDGACRANGNAKKARASIGVWFGSESDERNVSCVLPTELPHTNQTAELFAAITTLEAVPRDEAVTIRTDSMYVINSATKWRQRWIDKKWSPQLGLKNHALLRQLSDLLDARSVPIEWQHVRGHRGEPGNEAADRLANQALDKTE